MVDQDMGINWESCSSTCTDRLGGSWVRQLGNEGLFWAICMLSFWWDVLTASLFNVTQVLLQVLGRLDLLPLQSTMMTFTLILIQKMKTKQVRGRERRQHLQSSTVSQIQENPLRASEAIPLLGAVTSLCNLNKVRATLWCIPMYVRCFSPLGWSIQRRDKLDIYKLVYIYCRYWKWKLKKLLFDQLSRESSYV